jgi:hypothetical protein
MQFENQNSFKTTTNKKIVNNQESKIRGPFPKMSDNKITNFNTPSANIILKTGTNEAKSNVPIFNKNISPFKPPAVVLANKDEKVGNSYFNLDLDVNKKRFDILARINSYESKLLEYREKRIRSWNQVENLVESGPSFIDYIIKNSIEKKLKNQKEQIKSCEIHVDELLKDNNRRRSKGISNYK